MSDNPRLEYEGNVELAMEEGCYGVIYIDSGTLAAEIFKIVAPELYDGDADWFPERRIKARITVEVLETEVIDLPPAPHPLDPENWLLPTLPEGQPDNPQEA